jgi:hypothetical protein
MVLQPPQARVCSSSQSLEPSSGLAQLEAEIPHRGEALTQRQQVGVASGLLAQCFAITPERAWTVAADKADDEDSCLAQAKLRMVKDQAWPIIRGLRC